MTPLPHFLTTWRINMATLRLPVSHIYVDNSLDNVYNYFKIGGKNDT